DQDERSPLNSDAFKSNIIDNSQRQDGYWSQNNEFSYSHINNNEINNEPTIKVEAIEPINRASDLANDFLSTLTLSTDFYIKTEENADQM
ncbi:13906_t:CDS:2, partial [Entrophospora sp. SA101]